MPQPVTLKKLKLNGSMKTYKILELTPKKDVLFIIGDWNAKVGSQETPGVTGKLDLEYGMKQGKANRVLPRECTGHSKHPLPTTQEKTTHGHHQMVNTELRLIIFFTPKDGEALYRQQNKTGSRLWLDPDLLIAKYRLKLKKVGKTTRPFRYDLNQIPYDYTVEVRNRCKN